MYDTDQCRTHLHSLFLFLFVCVGGGGEVPFRMVHYAGCFGGTVFYVCICEQVLFVYVSTSIPPCLTDQRNFITVLIVTREPEQTTLLF